MPKVFIDPKEFDDLKISQEEKADLIETHNKVAQIKCNHWDYVNSTTQTKESDLKSSGYKSVADMVVGQFLYGQKEIDKLWKAFQKKWPD